MRRCWRFRDRRFWVGLGFCGPPVYLEVIRQSRGWPIALVSGAVTLRFLIGLVAIPNLPALYRRFSLTAVTLLAGYFWRREFLDGHLPPYPGARKK